MLNLHHASESDWNKQPESEWNRWQRMAARTHGVIAPANLVSLLGALVALFGLKMIWQGSVSLGIIVMLVGRVADIIDGEVADRTKTKSPFGEGFDATIDKVIILLTLSVIYWQALLPSSVLIILILFSLYNTVLGFYASWLKKIDTHPSLIGKLTTGLAWLTIALYVLTTQLKHGSLLAALQVVAAICFGLFVAGSLVSGYGYTKLAFKTKG